MAKRKAGDSAEVAWPLARLFSDHPERDAKRLRFDFEALAKTLEELARNPDNETPFTVVVRGSWGRGKTTLLRRAEALLEQPSAGGERDTKTLWFNAWKYPADDTVLAGLLGALVDRLRHGGWMAQAAQLAQRHKGKVALAVLRRLVPELPKLEGESGLEKAEEKRAYHDTFRQLFAELLYAWHQPQAAIQDTQGRDVEKWLKDHHKSHGLAVFLDDLDRCADERVIELLAAINLFLDLPGVCFFLGVDWERLREILHKKMPGREDAFLEKIVQVELELHDVSEEGAAEYVKGLLARGGLDWLQEADRVTFADVLEVRHPRHVKRTLNDLSLRLAVLRNVEKLGDGKEQLSSRVVVAWHLLREALPVGEWEKIRARPANFDAFLRQWKALGEEKLDAESLGEEGKRAASTLGLPEAVVELRRRGSLDDLVSVLDALSDEQRGLLLHFGSPPRSAPVRAAPGVLTGGASSRSLELGDLDGPAWVRLPAGVFEMGDSEWDDAKPHRVKLSEFRISRFPVTNRQYLAYVEATKKQSPQHWEEGRIPEGKEEHPVVYVSWQDAQAFCQWLGAKLGKGEVGLPTEAQWEYSARGTEGRRYPWGEEEPTPEHANFGSNVGDTTPVGAYPKGATPEGVLDLAGNVAEWCFDWYDSSYPDSQEADPVGFRVLRGGAFFNAPSGLRAAFRGHLPPELRSPDVGFRVVWRVAGGQGP